MPRIGMDGMEQMRIVIELSCSWTLGKRFQSPLGHGGNLFEVFTMHKITLYLMVKLQDRNSTQLVLRFSPYDWGMFSDIQCYFIFEIIREFCRNFLATICRGCSENHFSALFLINLVIKYFYMLPPDVLPYLCKYQVNLFLGVVA